jgi:sugar/nucleoside kinase (ribokinase family)
VLPASGVGDDLLEGHRDFFARWKLGVAALDARGADTPRTIVEYREDGSRIERSSLGDDHFASMAPRLADLTRTDVRFSGVYTFHDNDSARWIDLAALRRATGCTLLVELSADDRGADGWRRVEEILPLVDIVSLNAEEGRALTGSGDPATVIQRILAAGGRIVALRRGAHGSVVGSRSGLIRIAPTPVARVVDPTGAGNMYSGAFLGAYVRSRSAQIAGRIAAAAASFALEQVGPPPCPPDPREVARRVEATRPCA